MHRRIALQLVLFACSALVTAGGWKLCVAQDVATEAPQANPQSFVLERFESVAPEARAMVAEIQHRMQIPGMAAACAVDGRLSWAEGFGYADLEHQVPATPKTKFRVGSVSKMLTVGAVARLMEEGELDLDAPVQTYVPTFPEKEHTITTRHLCAHLSGIRHYHPADRGDSLHFDDVVEGLSIFQDDPLLHAPGEKWKYSSYAWNLVSAVVQGAAGKPFLETIDEQVFDPLEMHHTEADKRKPIVANRTEFYTRDPRSGEVINAGEIDISYKWAGGGFLSTVEDLVIYGSAYLPGSDFLEAETLEQIFTLEKTNDGEEVINGIGWRVGHDEDGRTFYHHGGAILGGRAFLLVMPQERIVVALLANSLYRTSFGRTEALALAALFEE